MRHQLFIGAISVLPLIGGCAGSDVAGGVSTERGLAAQSVQIETLRNAVRRNPRGDTPLFGPLEQARQAVTEAKAQAQVNDHAADALDQAEQSLSEAEQGWQAIADQSTRNADALIEIADQAHRAERMAQIARYTAQREIGIEQINEYQTRQQAQQRAPMGGSRRGGVPNVSSEQLIDQRVVPGLLGSLQFRQGSAQLTADSRPVIDDLAQLLSQHPDLGVAIFGFTDNAAPPSDRLQAFINSVPQLANQNLTQAQKIEVYRQGLSDARARDIARLLVEAGVDPSRIGARGMQDQHPIASNDTPEGRRRNERAEVVTVPMSRIEQQRQQ